MIRFVRCAALVAPALALAACAGGGASSPASPQPGNALQNLFFWGSATVPAPPPLPEDDDFVCPPVDVALNGAAHRVGGETVRVQYSLGDLARECTNVQRDHSFTLKIGAEGQVLLGPAGSPGRYDVSVRFAVKDGERVVASRVQRQSVTVPAGSTQGSFVMVEQGIQVPPGLKNLNVEVGFGTGGGEPRRRRR
ncbi:MAG: hypothetical protein BGP06_16615 [Rhizobiales bacterium 65-9]|nr:hypothetical protein [Hyphomicrobiales bacterium]OJY38078.1 MAG: hypothetical protein BGP06_16615 [Rhizobiales bacterium 65-9]